MKFCSSNKIISNQDDFTSDIHVNSIQSPFHKKLPNHWALLSGFEPNDDFGFKSDKLQIIYNDTVTPWQDIGCHAHSTSDEVYIVLEGEMIIDVNGVESIVRSGEFLFVPSNTFHQLKSVKTPVKSFVIRSPSINDKILKN